MDRERRQAIRSTLPESLPVRIGILNGRMVDLSTIGARVEHEEKLTVNSVVDIELQWAGHKAKCKGRVARSEISGRKGGTLIYQSGVQFQDLSPEASGLIAQILRGEEVSEPAATPATPEVTKPEPPKPAKPATPAAPIPVAPSPTPGGSLFLPVDDEDTMPYIMLRYKDNRWSKHYTASPQQPDEGLTISRDQAKEIAELQMTYETADPETRRMMRIAMAAQLGG